MKQMEKSLIKNKSAGKKSGIILSLLLAVVIQFSVAKDAKAACGACTDCATWQLYVQQEMSKHQQWMINEWWTKYVKPAMEKYTDEVRGAFVADAMMIGAFLDGESELNALRVVQELNANTLKSYQVGDSICKFGSVSRSLALSQERARANQIVLAERSQNRQLGHDNMASEEGAAEDRIARYNQFKSTFCDPQDYGSAMAKICTTPPADITRNLDINYTRLIDSKRTLQVDFAGAAKAAPSNDEKAVIALANNLYASDVLDRMQTEGLRSNDATDNRTTYLDQRAVVAKRSVAENSFNAIVGQKSEGGTASKAYLSAVLQKLGLPPAEIDKYLGANPSYDAQMEIVTKKIYQDPSFYASLMESPANVERQYAALQSFGLMQRRDIFETLLRSEMLMSLILEMEISKYQDNIQNQQNK